MIKRMMFLLLFQVGMMTLKAGGEWDVSGARFLGMGGISAAYPDGWSAINNPAGLAWEKKIAAGVYFGNRFLVKELCDKSVAASFPMKRGTIGIAMIHQGFSLYNEIRAGICYALRIGKSFSAGIRVDYVRIHFGDIYGNRNLASCDIGLQYRAGRNLVLGANVLNPVPVTICPGTGERLPVILKFGVSWTFIKNASAGAEIEKEIYQKPCIRAGFEYHVAKPLTLRIGFLSEPVTFCFGAGLETGPVRIDVASSYHLVLGYSPQASISYYFK